MKSFLLVPIILLVSPFVLIGFTVALIVSGTLAGWAIGLEITSPPK